MAPGTPLAASDAAMGPALVWTPGTDPGLAKALARADVALVEDGEDLAAELHRLAPLPAPRAGFVLSLSTATAYREAVALTLADELARRIAIAPATRESLATCLQEALMNSLVHGNLQIGSELRQRLEDYRRLEELMQARLADKRLGARRITVRADWNGWLDVTVRDEGGSRIVPPGAIPAADSGRKSGRGLAIIAKLADKVEYGREPGSVRFSFRHAANG